MAHWGAWAPDPRGVDLGAADVRIDAQGIFIDGAYSTPISQVRLLGEHTAGGADLNGSASVDLSQQGIGQLFSAAEQAVANAQAALAATVALGVAEQGLILTEAAFDTLPVETDVRVVGLLVVRDVALLALGVEEEALAALPPLPDSLIAELAFVLSPTGLSGLASVSLNGSVLTASELSIGESISLTVDIAPFGELTLVLWLGNTRVLPASVRHEDNVGVLGGSPAASFFTSMQLVS
ncbi:MAG: hypothetical protein ACI841_001518 [Planctomycetota bacterium]